MITAALGVILAVASSVNPQLMRATHYGPKLEGHTMANGHQYHARDMVVACNEYPLGTRLRLLNPVTLKGVYVVVTDRTAKTKHNKPVIDLSGHVFDVLGMSHRRGWGWIKVTPVVTVS